MLGRVVVRVDEAGEEEAISLEADGRCILKSWILEFEVRDG